MFTSLQKIQVYQDKFQSHGKSLKLDRLQKKLFFKVKNNLK